MLRRPESRADACVSTGLIGIIPHANDKVRASRPRPSDFCPAAQMIPCVPVITGPPFCTPANESSRRRGRLETPGGRQPSSGALRRVYASDVCCCHGGPAALFAAGIWGMTRKGGRRALLALFFHSASCQLRMHPTYFSDVDSPP